MKKSRIVYLDFIAGLLVLYMIFPVHVLSQTGLERYNYLSSVFFFFMAWFFYKAGMFFKPTDSKAILKKTFKRLMVPFLIFSVIGDLVLDLHFFLTGITSYKYYIASLKSVLIEGNAVGNIPLWFLLSLFIIHNGFNFAKKYLHPYVILAIAAVVPTCMHYAQIDIPVISHTFAGLFFFICGYVIGGSSIQLLKNINENLQLAVFASLFISIMIFNPVRVSFIDNDLISGTYPCWFISYLVAILVVNNLARIVSNKIPLQNSYIASIGKNSMVWLVSHWILLTMCRIVVDDMLGISNSYILAAVMASVCIFIIPLLSRLLNKPDLSWTIGK